MEFEIFMPCEPAWVCDSLLVLFAVLLVLGIVGFAFIVYKEYRKIQRATRGRRKEHNSKRQR